VLRTVVAELNNEHAGASLGSAPAALPSKQPGQ
jgi:hypothetical protein